MGTQSLVRLAIHEAAQRASHLCLAVRSEMLRHPEAMEKAGHEPVTLADYGAQAVILHTLAEHFPGDCSMAEERAGEFETLAAAPQRHKVIHHVGEALGHHVSLDDVRRWLDWGCDRAAKRVWVVDPIDGTKGFLRGDQFAIAIALIDDGQPMVAALACPLLPLNGEQRSKNHGVIAMALRGEGATLEPLSGGAGRPMRVSATEDVTYARLLESVEPHHTDHAFSGRVLAAAGVEGQTVRMDSQAKYAALADGRAEIYLRQSPSENYREKVWDHVAGALIVEEAGGQVTDLDGRRLDFSRGERLAGNRGILATNGLLHETVLSAIQRITRESCRSH